MLKRSTIAALAFAASLLPGAASAVVLTFDGISPTVVNAPYVEAGYQFDLNVGNAPGSEHFGDGAIADQLLDWHNGGSNANDAIVTMTKVGGGTFNLVSLDVIIEAATDLLINGVSFAAGSHNVNLTGVSSVSFDWTFTGQTASTGGIDNLVVNEAPEPGVAFLLGLGLAGVGFAHARRG